MADQLESIVQRMIDAGESEANIASVIKEFRPSTPAGHGTAAMLGTPSAPYAEGVNPAESWQNKAAAGLEPLAHPQTASDVASLLIPSGMGEAIGAIKSGVKGYISAGQRAMEGAPNLKSIPGRMLSVLYQDAKNPPVRGVLRGAEQYAPSASYKPTGAPIVPAPPTDVVEPVVDRYMANSGSPVPTASPGGHIVGHVIESPPSSGLPIQTQRVPYNVPPAGPAVLSDVQRLKAAGVPQWKINALQSDPQAMAHALAGLQ
jgi:hypothetical protein